ncbi:MAG: LysR family transcriptional regulator [Candidatus Accumulibacter sp.]|jgi:DNA-binding transcriptional LysR family regulator|nr:LysR family transcriptional regulator [Accumulibacter sp.]
MKHPIDGLEAFIQIAELGSFNKAAEKLHVTQTALTRRIQRLETFLGLKLLDRTTRVVSLTAVGRAFLPEAARLVKELDRSFERLRIQSRDSVGDVTMASVPSVMFGHLPAVLGEYIRRFPNNRVLILDRGSSLVMDMVLQRQAEFGLHVRPVEHPDLHTDLLRRDPFVAYCRKSHPLAERTEIRWNELAEFDLITLGGNSGNRALMEAQLSKSHIDIRTRFVAEYFSSAICLARAGLGVAILVAGGDGQLSGDMRQIPIVEPIVDRPLFLVRRRGETLTPAAQRLYALIRKMYSQDSRPIGVTENPN